MNLDSLKNLLTTFIDETDLLYFSKSRKVHYREVLYYNILCNLNDNGLRKANARCYERTRCDVGVSTLRDASKKLPFHVTLELITKLIQTFYPNRKLNNPGVYAIDSTVISITEKFDREFPFQQTNTGSYQMGYLSTIYDVTNRAAVAFKLDQSCDERAALIALSDYFQPGDILLVDAGYYSATLYNHFKSKGVELLCNLSASNKHIMSLEGDDIDFSHDKVSARKVVIRYTKDKEEITYTYGFITGKISSKANNKSLQ